MRTLRVRSCAARCGRAAVLVSLAAFASLFSSAATPMTSVLAANRPCSAVGKISANVTTHTLDILTRNNDKSVWYQVASQTFVDVGEEWTYTASLPGYETVWMSYAKAPSSYLEVGTNLATRTIATGPTVDLGTKVDNKKLIDTLLTDDLDRTLLYAVFTPITYGLTYDLDGGSWPSKFSPPQTATYDVAFTLKNPTKTGFDFTGWTAGGASRPKSGTEMVFSNLTTKADATVSFAAEWSRNSYDLQLKFADGVAKICYKVQNGDGTWPSVWQTVTNLTTVPVPFALKWRTYCETSEHWELSGTGTGENNYAEGTMGTDGATFAPAPTRKTYRLTLTANPPAGGTCGTSEGGNTYQSESDAHLWATPQTGYHFASWSDGSIENPHAVTLLCNTNIYANFEKNVYTVTFAYRNEKGVLTTEEQSVAYGESATEPGTDKRNVNTGYVFENWDNSTWKTIVGNLNVTADYTANSYTVKFVGNGGVDATSSSRQEYTQSFNYNEEKNLTANTFSRTGYTFAGWSTTVDATSSSRHYSDGELVKNIVSASDGTPLDTGATLVLYAQWEPIAYTIEFLGVGGSELASPVSAAYDTPISLPPVTVDTFVSWTCSADGLTYTNGETVVRLASEAGATVTMTANWSDSRAVTFVDAASSPRREYTQSFTANREFSLLPNTFTQTGYTFAGWSPVDANFCSRHYPDQSLVTSPTNLTLCAVWQPNAYQVTFDANNGTGAKVVTNFTYDVDLTPTNALGLTAPTGLDTFVGWGTNETTVVYTPSDPRMNLTPVNGDHIKLYAIWGLNEKNLTDYSKALTCKNLVWQPNPGEKSYWRPDTTNEIVSYTVNGNSTLYAGVNSGKYDFSFDWKPASPSSRLKITLGQSPVLADFSGEESEWKSYRLTDVEVTASVKLYFRPTNPCELRNVRWTRVPTETCPVTFELGAGTRTRSEERVYGGETNQVVEAGHVALEPTVTPPAGMVLAKWKVGDLTVDVDSVATQVISVARTFEAKYTNAEYKVIYVDARTDRGYVNPNPSTFTKDDETFTLDPIQNDEESKATAPDFLGWVLGRDQKIASTGNVTIPQGTTSNVVVTALWAECADPDTYAVRFVTIEDGVATTNAVVVESGKNAEMPTPAARAGYAFVGWDRSADAVTSDRTLTAQYEKISYPISYRNTRGLVNGNSIYGNLPQSYTVEDAITLDRLIPDAESTDWTFLGWSADGGKTLTTGIAKGTTGELVFTAVWQSTVPQTVTINGKSRQVAYGETVTESTAARVTKGQTNVVCVGWIGTGSVPAAGKGNTVTFKVTEPSTLDWLYQTNYWVNASAGKGGTVSLCDAGGESVPVSGWYAAGTNLVAEATPAEGWFFARWDLADTDGDPREDAMKSIASTYDFTVLSPVTLTAVFTQKVVRTTFDVSVAVATGCEKMGTVSGAKKSVKPGTKVTVRATAKSGSVFSAWHLADANFCSRQTVDADVSSASAPVSQSASYTFAMPSSNVTLFASFLAKGDDWARVSVGEVESEYAKGAAIDPIAVTAEGGSLPTIKVTGLPAGLKFTAKLVTSKKTEIVGSKRVTTLVTNALPNTIYGTPTRSGVYAATVTATTAGKATASTNVTFIVVDRAKGEQVVTTEVLLVDANFCSRQNEEGSVLIGRDQRIASTGDAVIPGKTTGQGVYAAGKKVTLKATANKGYVFSGWYPVDANFCSRQNEEQTVLTGRGEDAASTLVSRLASLALTVPAHDVAYAAAFVTLGCDAASISASVNGMAVIASVDADVSAASSSVDAASSPRSSTTESSASTALTVVTNVPAGVYLQWPVVADALSATTVAVSGLPTGLKFTAKPITSKVSAYGESGKRVYITVTNVPAMTIYGRPTAASKVNAKTGAVTPSQVKVTVTTAGKNKVTGVIALTVDALPTALVGTFVGGAPVDANFCSRQNEDESVLTGRDQTIASTGSATTDAASTGSASVTLAATGKISGKWISEGATWTLSAAGLDYVDADVSSASDATGTIASAAYVATNVTAKCGKLVETLTLVFSVNDLGYGEVIAPVDANLCSRQNEDGSVLIGRDQMIASTGSANFSSASALFSATYVPWKTDATLKDLAKELRNETFDITLDAAGTPRLQGKVGANGTVSVKGTFSVDATSSSRQTSYTATVSSTLVPLFAVDADFSSASEETSLRFQLFLYYPPKTNKFDGYATTLILVWDGETFAVE